MKISNIPFSEFQKLSTTKKLIRSGQVGVNDVDHGGWSPLQWACYSDSLKIAKYLISKGANINYLNFTSTPLTFALSQFNYNIVKYLILKNVELKKLDTFNHILRTYEVQKLICERYINGYSILKKNNIQIHEWIKEEYFEESITDELGFFD